jgi:hypothetical protein
MADETCVCPQCGKKYKLKEGFDARSFSCKSCGATVWVAGKAPAPAPTSRRSGPPASRKASRAAASGAGGRKGRRSREREEAETEEGGRRGRYEKPKSNANLFMAIGAVAVIGIIVVVAVMSGKKDDPQPVAQQPADETGTTDGAGGTGLDASGTGATPPGTTSDPAGSAPAGSTPPSTTTEQKPPGQAATPQGTEAQKPESGTSAEGGEPPTSLGGGKKPSGGKGQWDPPATLGHLETTPPELRKQIDELVAVLLDPMAGKEVHEAKAKLAAIGKPAFLPILGGMAKIRDTLADDDSFEEKRIESSLMLADQCLREMDGYLDSHDKGLIRPGTDNKYIKYILVLHYRRWLDGLGSTPLKDMAEMPGPFDPTKSPRQPDPDDPDAGTGRPGK